MLDGMKRGLREAQGEAAQLASWLNQNRETQAGRNVAYLVTWFRDLEFWLRLHRVRLERPTPLKNVASIPGVLPPDLPGMNFDISNPRVRVTARTAGEGRDLRVIFVAEGNDAESQAVMLLARLSRLGLLDYVRPCECGQWFLAERRDHRHHSAACRGRSYRKSDKGRRNRAKYMRDYRANIKREWERAQRKSGITLRRGRRAS
jgi:hypothetical protein